MEPKSLSLHHILRTPKKPLDKSPVLFLFHGYGSDENDLFSFASELPDSLFIISVRAPYTMQPQGNAWYAIHYDSPDGKWSNDAQAITSRDKIAQCIDEAIAAYPIDAHNVSLLGFSQGAILSYAVALSYPDKIKNVIALSGYINTEIIKEGYLDKDYTTLSIYCSHGSADQVIPVDWARKAPELLATLGIFTKLEEFPAGHGVAPQNFYAFNTWLEQHL